MNELEIIRQYLKNKILTISEIEYKTTYDLFLIDYLSVEVNKIESRISALENEIKPWSTVIDLQKI